MRVLVCGGRYYDDFLTLHRYLDQLRSTRGVTCVIQGGASGADSLALTWAVSRGVAHETYPAEWGRDGRAAGPIRNERMLREGKPDLVVAFPGGRGTADMLRRAQAAGIEVLEVAV